MVMNVWNADCHAPNVSNFVRAPSGLRTTNLPSTIVKDKLAVLLLESPARTEPALAVYNSEIST